MRIVTPPSESESLSTQREVPVVWDLSTNNNITDIIIHMIRGLKNPLNPQNESLNIFG